MKTNFYQSTRPQKPEATWNDAFIALAKLIAFFAILILIMSSEKLFDLIYNIF